MDHSLFELEKDYYLGNYQSCINKANSLPPSNDLTYYMCLSYFHLKKFDILESELAKSDELCISIIKLLVSYAKDVAARNSIITQLDALLDQKLVDPKDHQSRLLISSIYAKEKLYGKALKALHKLDTLPSFLARISVYLQMNRVDLAEHQVKLMQSKDDYATLTLLAVAQVRLASGRAKEALDIAEELEDKYRATPMINNLQTAAAVCAGNLDVGKSHCEKSLDLDHENEPALVNMVHILTKTRSPRDVRDRYYNKLKSLYPENQIVKQVDSLEHLSSAHHRELSSSQKETIVTPEKPVLHSLEERQDIGTPKNQCVTPVKPVLVTLEKRKQVNVTPEYPKFE